MSSGDFFREFDALRGEDVYPTEEMRESLVAAVFPASPAELALRLSGITAAFYGYLLRQAGLQLGWERIDPLSRALFHDLGELKAREALESGIEVPRDARAPAIVLVTAIFTSSPQYRFELRRYEPERTELRLFGKSRYYAIASKLGIARYLTWPVLVPFFAGIADSLGVSLAVDAVIERLEEDGECDYRFAFSAGNSADAPSTL